MAILTNPANSARMEILTKFHNFTDKAAILTNPARMAILTNFAEERLSSR